MLIYATKEENPQLKSIRQKEFHTKLRYGLFIKLMKMLFGGFYGQFDKFVNAKEPSRARDLNLACLYLTPSKFTCSFRHLQNAIQSTDVPLFERNIKLIKEKSSEFMKTGKGLL